MTLKQLKYRIPLIFVQFICSAFVAYCLYKTGPHWILTCLLVPPFRLYLMLHLSKQKRQSSPNESYRNIIRSRNWHQVEVTICLTMAVVFFGFSILLLYGFLKLMANACYLLAGFASISASLLYVINSLIIVGSLRQGTIMDIEVNKKPLKQLSYAEVKNSNPLSETAKNGQEMLMLRDKLMKQPEESNELYELSNQSNNNKIITNYRISELMGYETLQLNRIFASENSQIKPTILTDQQQEANQKIISCICEEIDQNLNNQISCDNNCSNNKESKICNINNNDNYCYNNNNNNNYNHNCNSGNSNINNRINNNSNNNKKNNKNNNNNNNNNDNDVTTVDSKARYRYPSAEYLNILNFDRLCNQKPLQQRHAGNFNQNSKRKLRQIPLIVKTAGMGNDQSWRLNCSCRIEHYSDQIRAMCENHKFDNRFNNKRLTSGCSELKIYESNGQGDRLVDSSNPRQYQHFASMIDEQGGTVVHGKKYLRKERSNCKSNSYDILSNEYNNLFDNRPNCLPKAVSAPISHNDKNNWHGRIINEMKPSSSNVQEISHVVAHTFGDHQRNNNNNNNNREQRRYHSRHSYSREPSKIIQHRSHTYARSDDEGLESHNDNDIIVRNKCTTEENSLWKHGSVIGPSCIPSIVAFIDSGRESEINRNNFPKRTSSMDKKMRNKGLEMMMTRARSEEYLRKRRRTRSISSSSYEKPTDEYFVTEF